MTRLIYLGTPLDIGKEHEFRSDNEFGFDITITYNGGEIEFRNNITEVHHLYKSYSPAIAFESDIHSTGGTVRLNDIDVVVIVMASFKHDSY